MLLGGCVSSAVTVQPVRTDLVVVKASMKEDSLAQATIAPYTAILNQQMQTVIGHAAKRLSKEPVESHLGNFVADAILTQARLNYSGTIDIAAITNGGLRAPIPEGPIKVSTVYELMPFENILYILELTGEQTQALFDHMAIQKRTAVANTVALFKEDRLHKLFVDGAPFDPGKTYILAISDYLAEGGDGMEFLKEAKLLAQVDVKIRDLIINQIKHLEQQDLLIDAQIEGRVKILP